MLVELLLFFTYVVMTVVFNYRSFRRVYEVTTLMAHSLDVDYPSITPLIKHHLFVVVGMGMAVLGTIGLSYAQDARVGYPFSPVAGWLVLR